MQIVPSGSVLVGAGALELKQEGVPLDWMEFAQPQHTVVIKHDFAVSRYPITLGEFRQFVRASGFEPSGGCVHYDGTRWKVQRKWSWKKTSFEQTDRHPVVCVNWFDAEKYVHWLNRQTGGGYRLLSEDEWEYAARGGSKDRRYWGDDTDHSIQCQYANGADFSYSRVYGKDHSANLKCSDGYAHTSPVGAFRPNAFGLFDMLGNVNQWVDNCVDSDTSSEQRQCRMKGLRGGAWSDPPWAIRSADRYRDLPSTRCMGIGFRIAKTL
ncbi:SUMF1/EgtB/PvdO family nonheme iron enzyme [Methylocystis sp. SC2]|uniref:formylglycine-generating enzyme family protein n=1 Tax=Methylocystis sp. (strain SC2) TaxID=187303 RepID=UPI00027AF2C1|nr:Conserved hypothetical protein [Methylocystis sp. SC2]